MILFFLIFSFISFLILWSLCVVAREPMIARTPNYYDEETAIVYPETPIACEMCGDVKKESEMQIDPDKIGGVCKKCQAKESLAAS